MLRSNPATFCFLTSIGFILNPDSFAHMGLHHWNLWTYRYFRLLKDWRIETKVVKYPLFQFRLSLVWNFRGSYRRGRHKSTVRRTVVWILGKEWREMKALAVNSGWMFLWPFFRFHSIFKRINLLSFLIKYQIRSSNQKKYTEPAR